MHMLLFDIVPHAQWCTCGIVQRASLSLRKVNFSVPHEATSAPLSGRHHANRTCATRANVSRRSSLIKASTLWMCWSVRDVDIRYVFLPSLKRSIH
jgi:hypothetical protein